MSSSLAGIDGRDLGADVGVWLNGGRTRGRWKRRILNIVSALVAQRIEHLTTDQKVGGSSPSERATYRQVRAIFSSVRGGPAACQGPCLPTRAPNFVERSMILCEDGPVGWEALEQWGDDAVRIEPLTGGAGVNAVWSVRVNGHLAVGRLGQRSDADLTWETGLLRYLDREGMTVPVPIPTTDGRQFADGLVVMTHVEGGPPETEADWRRVADTLRQLHRLTKGWPQRPGWRSSPTSCMPRPGRGSTSARCRPRVSFDAGQRGRDSPVARRASSTATPTLATSA